MRGRGTGCRWRMLDFASFRVAEVRWGTTFDEEVWRFACSGTWIS